MFDISMGEFILILLVLLAFLGPERIPIIAKKTGEFIHAVKMYFTALTEEITENENTAQVFNEVQETVKDIATVVNVKKAVREMGKPLLTPLNVSSKKEETPSYHSNLNDNSDFDASDDSTLNPTDKNQTNDSTFEPPISKNLDDKFNEEVEDFSNRISGNRTKSDLEQPFRVFDPEKK